MQWQRATMFLMLSAMCLPIYGRELYVDNVAGDDRFDGTAAEPTGEHAGPFRTITRALEAAYRGDRVILANTGEAYRESLTLQGGRLSGLAGIPFELIGNGAVLDGTVLIPAEGWRHYRGEVFRFRPPRTSFQVIYLNGQPLKRTVVEDGDEIESLAPLHWCLFQQHVYFRVEAGRLPQSYDLHYTGLPVGITLYEVHDVVVRDLVVQGFQLDGINAHDGVWNATLDGLTCRGNGRSGVSIGGASRVRVEACLVGNNGAAQIRAEGRSRVHLVGCDLLDTDTAAPDVVRDGGQVVVEP